MSDKKNISLKPGWRRVKFGDVVRQCKEKANPETSGLQRYVAGDHMDTYDLRLRRWGEIGSGYLGPAFHIRFRPGQVLYGSRRTYLRKVAVADFDGICANTTFVLEPKDPNELLPQFLPFLMQTEAFNNFSVKNSKGSVNPYINFSDLERFEFILPPTTEQIRVVEASTAYAEHSERLREAREAAGLIRRAVLLDTFRPARGSVDSFPAHWRLKRVDEVGDVQLGQQRHPKYEKGENIRPYLRVANVLDGWIDFSDLNEMHFPEAELAKFELQPGDVLLNEGQSFDLVGRSAIYRGEVPGLCCQKTLIRFRCGSELLPEFAQAYFQHRLYTGQFAAMCVQTTSMAHLTAVRFAAMLMPVPPLSEQAKVSAVLKASDEAATVLHRRSGQMATLRPSSEFIK